jgi:hypothetical protein
MLLPLPYPDLDPFGGTRTLILLFSPLEPDPRCSGLCGGCGSVSTSFISLCRLPWLATCLGDDTLVVTEIGPVKESALLASRKSVSGHAIFNISKKRS